MSTSGKETEVRRSLRLPRLLMAGLFALGACQANPETAHVAVQPRTAPVRTITSFNEALRCMDDLFLAQGKKDIYVTSAGIPDATGQIAAGTPEDVAPAIVFLASRAAGYITGQVLGIDGGLPI